MTTRRRRTARQAYRLWSLALIALLFGGGALVGAALWLALPVGLALCLAWAAALWRLSGRRRAVAELALLEVLLEAHDKGAQR